jgi:hypothetical protein
MSGSSFEACVGFAADLINGQTVMNESGIQYRSLVTGYGSVVCQVDREPAEVGGCANPNQPRWALFVFSMGHWSQPGTAYVNVQLRDTEAIGWHYVRAAATALTPPPPPHALAS